MTLGLAQRLADPISALLLSAAAAALDVKLPDN
jgi:hypothetical protein